MQLTISKIEKAEWYAGMLQDVFTLSNGAKGKCNSSLYRNRMQSVNVTVYGVGRRGFAFADKPVDWNPQVGDVVSIHPTQL